MSDDLQLRDNKLITDQRIIKSKSMTLSSRIALIYAVIGSLWILLSDKLALMIFNDSQTLTIVAIIKGWVYVIATAGMLYWLIEKGLEEIEQSRQDLRAGEEKILYQAYHDALTGLPNRVNFKEYLQEVIKDCANKGHMGSLVFLDLDLFKNINDSLGHAIGDLLLVAVAQRLVNVCDAQCFVARMSGDEFAILKPEISSIEDATKLADKILSDFKDAFIIEGYELYVSASIGVCIFPNDGDDQTTLIKHADTAMYQAKKNGRNTCVSYGHELNSLFVRRMTIENKLRKALERNELYLHYQPQIDVYTQEILGLEALLRWDNKDIGPITPLDFIPIAEETGLILPIGEWVIRTACKQNQAWINAGYKPLRISVNVSIRQLYKNNFLASIAEILKETGMSPELLTIEITESILIQNAEESIRILNSIKSLGAQISIDDFGTGYSSLSYLQRLPIDILKIDRSFVKDISTDLDISTIVETIIHMAHCLRKNVIAEGIETEEQQEFLKEKGCNEMQGFLFSRPIPASEVEKILQLTKE